LDLRGVYGRGLWQIMGWGLIGGMLGEKMGNKKHSGEFRKGIIGRVGEMWKRGGGTMREETRGR